MKLKSLLGLTFGFLRIDFTLYAISANDAAAYIIQFKDAVKELAGGPTRSYLKEMVGFEKCEGASALIKGAYQANLSAGADTALASITNRYTYDQLASNDASVLASHVLTRNDTGTFQRSQVLPIETAIGSWQEMAEKDFLAMGDPHSKEMRNFMQGYFTKQDLKIINALFASTVTRVTNEVTQPATATTTSNISMPVTQVLNDVSLATVDIKLFSDIYRRFLSQYVSGQKVYVGMGPSLWKALVDNSGDKLMNQDYIRDAGRFESGQLPEVFGCVPVVHPLFENTTLNTNISTGDGEVGLIGAWTEDGLTWAEFGGMKSMMEVESPAFKGMSIALIKEFTNAVRNHDLLCVNGAVVA